MRRFRIGVFLAAALLAAVANGCFIGIDDVGKACKRAADCPQVGLYRCVAANAWPQAECTPTDPVCFCEVKFPPEPIDAGPIDAGPDAGPPYVDAGPIPDYCTDIRPKVQLSCLGTCHTAQMGYPNSPKTFRLDYYNPSPDGGADGGPGLPGLHDLAPLAYGRITDVANPMPPKAEQLVFLPYNAEEKAVFAKWLDAGFPLGDGGCEAPGYVSFKFDIQPIFTQRCTTACHNTSLDGGLNLSIGNAYANLVNVDTSANCNDGGFKRVAPNDPKSSMLWRKLTPDGGCCNATMPRGGMILRQLAPTQFDKIEAWITQGAPQN